MQKHPVYFITEDCFFLQNASCHGYLLLQVRRVVFTLGIEPESKNPILVNGYPYLLSMVQIYMPGLYFCPLIEMISYSSNLVEDNHNQQSRLPCEMNPSEISKASKYFTQRFKSSFVKFLGLVILNLNRQSYAIYHSLNKSD